jgi:AraC-like DNA-binding protein
MVLLDNGGRPCDELQFLLPADDVSAMIEQLSIQQHREWTSDWRVIPDASPHLIAAVVESAGVRRLRVVLVGPRSRAAAVDLSGRIVTVCLRLRPGALPALVRDSAAQFTDRSVAIGDVFSRSVLEDLELAHDAPPSLLADEMTRLVRRAARQTTVGPTADAIASLSAASAKAAVHRIISTLAVPERTFRDRARREIGLSPKPALRILRLQRALMLAKHRNRGWADVAQLAGYADQAHLTRECRSLLGETPSAWRARGLSALAPAKVGLSTEAPAKVEACRFLQDTAGVQP